jgi:hypothetical protein
MNFLMTISHESRHVVMRVTLIEFFFNFDRCACCVVLINYCLT